jgi:GNAT superfamily N-acetyltransferase
MEIRRARVGDGEALVRIHAEMAEHYAELDPERFRVPDLEGYAAIVDAELGDGLDLVAEVDGEVVAWLYARLVEPHEHARFAYPRDVAARRLSIDYLATRKAHRRTGAGTALVQAAEDWGREQGATVAETTTYHLGGMSMAFWTGRVGYQERSLNLRKPLTPGSGATS